ncbi:hypothetical protein PYW07_000601 [Mythimna separata]|uniref:L-lactate dehydrogenase n=1 Tax=Mythimna separata TaxID=271217 RepID=A0AAD7Z3V9_MYTSE|nr:hypothetical protein PYW07_000601 [Mythimna separata]
MFRITRSVGPQLIDSVLHKISSNANCVYGFIPAYNKCSNHYSKFVTPIDKSSKEPEGEAPCKQYTTLARIFNVNTPKYFGSSDKVSIVGLDDIGMAIVYTLLVRGITNNICMIDMNEDILEGEKKDLQSSALFLNNARIHSSKDPADTHESRVCIVTTGTYKGRDEEVKDYISRSAGIVRAIVAPLAKHSPDAIFIVASDPVDVLTHVAWRLSGFPKSRIIGTGTLVDSARFQYLLSNKLGVAPEACSAYIIGEHGPKNSVPVWSNVNVAGVRLADLNPQIGLEEDPEMWQDLYTEAVTTDDEVRQLKGTVSWSVGLAVAEICNAIFSNTYTVLPVSTHVKGEHSIRDDIFLSLPCVIGNEGVSNIIRQKLSHNEAYQLRKGATNVRQYQELTDKSKV